MLLRHSTEQGSIMILCQPGSCCDGAAGNAFFCVSMELFSCREVCLSRQEVKLGSAQQRWFPSEEGAELVKPGSRG